MDSAVGAGNLLKLLEYYYEYGFRGFLVSGGFNSEGYLPLGSEYLSTLRVFRRGRDVFLSVHAGLMPRELLDRAMEVFDLVDFEVPPSDRYVREGRGLRRTRDNYVDLLSYLVDKYGEDRVAPHVVIGSSLSTAGEDLRTVEDVGSVTSRLLVILVAMGSTPPEVSRVVAVFKTARRYFREVALGCMRPRTLGRVFEELALGGYVDRFVNPSRRLVEQVPTELYGSCCSLPEGALASFRLELGEVRGPGRRP
ncbi:MAG: hypothetical protein LM571_05510 [Desulfurococcaceae archaeon]|nr:hypothetical protein [Desulfurococcaceae archaeon]